MTPEWLRCQIILHTYEVYSTEDDPIHVDTTYWRCGGHRWHGLYESHSYAEEAPGDS